MKFSRDLQESLQREEYPQEWIDSAISYKKLKKCINRIQQELLSLGLDHDTLQKLWQHVGSSTAVQVNGQNTNGSTFSTNDRMLHYAFAQDADGKPVQFTPKLTIALDPRDGSPMDAWLSPETRRVLRRLGRRQCSVSATTVISSIEDHNRRSDSSLGSEQGAAAAVSNEQVRLTDEGNEDGEVIETIEIPLTSDSEFFQVLRRELSNVERIQEREQSTLQNEILQLGQDLRALKISSKKRSRGEIETWREIFRLYLDSQVFVSSHEQDAGARDSAHAEKQLQIFRKSLASEQGKSLKLTKEADEAVKRFIRINVNLLQLLKYQEINRTALTKIMKKFDKRTALHAKDGILTEIAKRPFVSQDLAKATCFTISDELVNIIPQLDDYLCPVCFSISYKPIRLRCQHVFCIRCLIVMQQAEQDDCPLCRSKVVLEATGENLDESLKKFLELNFKREVKVKQKENEIAAGVDRFGEGFEGTHRCCVM